MGAFKKTPTEGGSGGKRGHSNMENWVHTDEIKDAARTQPRIEDRRESSASTEQLDDARQIARVEWWLMDSLPELNWARLSVLSDGEARVFDCDGKTHAFPTEEDARTFLLEDEFQRWNSFEAADFTEAGMLIEHVRPPEGASDAELLPKMLARSTKK